MQKPVVQYEYRGHEITVTGTKIDGFTLRIRGTHLNVVTDASSLDYLDRAVRRTIDSLMDQKLGVA